MMEVSTSGNTCRVLAAPLHRHEPASELLARDLADKFEGPATSRRYFGVQFHLENLLGYPVDLVTEKALRAELRPHIKNEAVYV